ncbi:MAG: hypothetical protein ACOYO1_14685 [Bacteroidales bacterium]
MKHYYSLKLIKVLLFLVVMFCSSFVRGQSFESYPNDNVNDTVDDAVDDTVKTKLIYHEFGMGLYSQPNFGNLSGFIEFPQNKSIEFIFLLIVAQFDTIYSNPQNKFFNTFSFFYKLHWKENGFRIAFSSNTLNYKTVVDSTYWNTTISGWFRKYSGSYQMNKLSIGYERNYRLKKFDFYGALDLAYYWGSLNGYKHKGFGNPDASYALISNISYDINISGFSAAPSFGIRYHLWKVCAISAEMNLNFLYTSTKDAKGYYPSYSRFKIYTNPLSLLAFSMYF